MFIMKLKKVLALVLAAVMTLSLAACGGSSTDTSAASEDTSTQDEMSTTADSSEAGSEESELTYASVVLGESYTDITTSIKWIHNKTDREEDGKIAELVSEFNKVYPNITVETGKGFIKG